MTEIRGQTWNWGIVCPPPPCKCLAAPLWFSIVLRSYSKAVSRSWFDFVTEHRGLLLFTFVRRGIPSTYFTGSGSLLLKLTTSSRRYEHSAAKLDSSIPTEVTKKCQNCFSPIQTSGINEYVAHDPSCMNKRRLSEHCNQIEILWQRRCSTYQLNCVACRAADISCVLSRNSALLPTMVQKCLEVKRKQLYYSKGTLLKACPPPPQKKSYVNI